MNEAELKSILVEVVPNQDLPDDIKLYTENGRFWIDITSPVLLTRQKIFGDYLDVVQKLHKTEAELDEARRLLEEITGYSRSVRARPDSLMVEIRAFLGVDDADS